VRGNIAEERGHRNLGDAILNEQTNAWKRDRSRTKTKQRKIEKNIYLPLCRCHEVHVVRPKKCRKDGQEKGQLHDHCKKLTKTSEKKKKRKKKKNPTPNHLKRQGKGDADRKIPENQKNQLEKRKPIQPEEME